MNTQNIKYFVYARKSTDAEDRQVRSIPDQLAEMRELAVHLGVEIVDIFTESQTAKAPGRPVFNEMIARIEAGDADGILSWHPDRLARNLLDGMGVVDMLARRALKDLKFCTFPFDNTSAGRYMLAMMFCQSTYYVDNLSDNVKRGFRHKLKNGVWPEKAPIGYRNHRPTRTIELDPVRAPIIRKSFELYATGKYSIAQVRDQAAQMGLIGTQGATISLSQIQHILKNPFYHGIMRFKGEFHEGKHEPLISKKLFDQTQNVMHARSQPRKHPRLKPYLYRGMFHCGSCGCLMTIETQKGHNYLRCTRKKGPCKQPFVREEEVVKQIQKAVALYAIPEDIAEQVVAELEIEQREQISRVDAQIQTVRNQVGAKSGNLNRLVSALADGTLSGEEFRLAKNRVLLEKRDLEEKAVQLEKTRLGWLEPAIKFVKACSQTTLQQNANDAIAQRDFFRKIGSNRIIENKRVGWEPRGAWKHVENAGRFARQHNAASCEAALLAGEPDQHVWQLGD